MAGTHTRKSLARRADGSCPAGYHTRKAYTVRRTGTRVEPSCVRATTSQGARSNFLRSTRRSMSKRLQGFRKSARGPSSCPKGQIVRNAYVRIRQGERQYVAASCIKDVGNPGKGLPSGAPGIGALRKGDLKQFGYTKVKTLSPVIRHAALTKAVTAYGSLAIWRKLNALFIYSRHTAPDSSKVFKEDRDWVKAKFGIRAFKD